MTDYDEYYDAAKKDGEVIQGEHGGRIDVHVTERDAEAVRRPVGRGTVAALSWSGFNVYGDEASIKAVRAALHDAGTVPELKRILAEMQRSLDPILRERFPQPSSQATNPES